MNNGRTYLQKALSRFCDIPHCGTSELGSSPVKTARWPLGYVPGGHFLFANTPLRHSYHSRSVIARSGSGSRQTVGNRILSLKLSERLSLFCGCRCFSFSSAASFSFKKHGGRNRYALVHSLVHKREWLQTTRTQIESP